MLRITHPVHELEFQLHLNKLLDKKEFRFALPHRQWRFDFAWPDKMLACEVEGGIHTGGRHTRGVGFEKDLEKYAAALILGWKVLRVDDKMIRDGRALKFIIALYNSSSEEPTIYGGIGKPPPVLVKPR